MRVRDLWRVFIFLLGMGSMASLSSGDEKQKSPEGRRPHPERIRESFVGTIQSGDDETLPGLDFVIKTKQKSGDIPFLPETLSQPDRFIRVHRDYDPEKAAIFRDIEKFLRDFERGKTDVRHVFFAGKYSELSEKTAGFDGDLELTTMTYYPKDLSVRLPSGGFAFDGVIGSVVGGANGSNAPPITVHKEKSLRLR
jgi:hypothetical protein